MNHSITNRVIVGKSIGFLVGILVFFTLPMLGVPLDVKFRLGLLLFYILLGGLIGLSGTLTEHPVLKFPLPFWIRGALLGVLMHLMLVLLTYDQFAQMLETLDMMGMTSPFWALIDGVILGIIIDWAATKEAGEGDLPLK